MAEMKDWQLKATALGVRQGILEGRSHPGPSMMCFAICAPLQGYLSFLGVEANLIEGEIRGSDCNHVWLELQDGRILDPTADQFKTPTGEGMPKIYLGKQPDWYLTP